MLLRLSKIVKNISWSNRFTIELNKRPAALNNVCGRQP